MSQYPSPYDAPSPMQFGGYQPWQQPLPDLLAPARRAAWLMITFGSIALLCGMCTGTFWYALPSLLTQMPAEQTESFRQIEKETGLSAQTLFGVMAIISTLAAVSFLVLGILTRGGKLRWVITSVVLTSLCILLSLTNLFGSLVSGVRGLGGACMSVIFLSLFGLLMVWLIQAIRAAGRIKQIQAQYQSGYWPQQYPPQPGYGYDPSAYQQGWYPPPPPPEQPPSNPPDKT